MRFLVDACAGVRLAEWLVSQGHEAISSREIGLDPGDRKLLERAVRESRILVTMDKDFGRFLFAERLPHCGVVRLPDVPGNERLHVMEQVLLRHAVDLKERAVITVRGGRMRVSHTP